MVVAPVAGGNVVSAMQSLKETMPQRLVQALHEPAMTWTHEHFVLAQNSRQHV